MTPSVRVFDKQTKLPTLLEFFTNRQNWQHCCKLRISTYLQFPSLFVTYGVKINKYKTRMHSSRMRTACSLTVSRSIQWGGGECWGCACLGALCMPREGEHACQGVCMPRCLCQGACMPGGMCARGCACQGDAMHVPMNRMTDRQV